MKLANDKSKKGMKVRISFLLICAMMTFPVTVHAADREVMKEKIITAQEETEEAYIKAADFPEEIKEEGKTYLLGDLDFEILKKTYLDKKEKIVESPEMANDTPYEPQLEIEEGGIKYVLTGTEKEERILQEADSVYVTAYEDYDYEVSAYSVPATKTVSAYNEVSGREESVVCYLKDIQGMGTRTVGNTISITFSEYDASWYEWNGHLLPRNDEIPAFAGYEAELLASVGAEAGSSITGLAWTGEPYTDASGVLCRDAVAEIQQIIPIYRANYEGTYKIEERKMAKYKSTYEGDDPDGRISCEVKVTAKYVRKQMPVMAYVFTGVGIVILLGAVVGVLMIFAKRRKEKEHAKFS